MHAMKLSYEKAQILLCLINVLTCFRTRPKIIAKTNLETDYNSKSTFFVYFMNEFFHTESMKEFCNLTKFEWSVITRTAS